MESTTGSTYRGARPIGFGNGELAKIEVSSWTIQRSGRVFSYKLCAATLNAVHMGHVKDTIVIDSGHRKELLGLARGAQGRDAAESFAIPLTNSMSWD